MLVNAVLLVAATHSLLDDRRDDAESIERQIRSMPGVVATELGYLSSVGDRHTFLLAVRLASDVTEQQAVAVGQQVIDGMGRSGLDGHDARLHLHHPAVPHPNPYVPDFSQAEFWFNPDVHEFPPDPYQVADSIGLWLRAARSPVTAHVNLKQAWNSTARVRFVDLTLRTEADDTGTELLADDIGDRAVVTWRLVWGADYAHRPHVYNANPLPPTDSAKQTFLEISRLVDAADQLDIYTRALNPLYADTSVVIRVADGPGSEERERTTAESVAKALPRFGPEVTLAISGHESAVIVVGGCHFREGQTSNSELERRLSEMFETC
jgi:hypothetical protein